MQVAEIANAREKAPARRRASLVSSLAVFGLLFALVLLLQWRTGAFTAELSGYPDEASHYLSGLLVHDYAVSGFPQAPMPFAKAFYLHYPYLAIGHWPPAFYAVEGAWMVLFSPSRGSAVVLMALITALLAFATYRVVRADFGIISAWIAAVALIGSPVVFKYSSMIMLDTPVALLSFLAVLCFGRFLESGRWQDSAKFAGLASLAMLTKANAADLALAVLFGLVASRRMDALRKRAFWIPASIGAAICVPWHLATMRLMIPTFTADEGFRFTVTALGFFSSNLLRALTAGFAILAIIGFYGRVVRPLRQNGRSEPKWAMIGSLPFAVIIFHSLVPAGLERRYLIAAVPSALVLSAAGAIFLAERLPISLLSCAWKERIALAGALLIFAGQVFPLPAKQSFGFQSAADRVTSDPLLRKSLILVSSETNTAEGIFVSEMAMRKHGGPEPVILRASKVLAVNSWNQSLDANYKALLPDAEAVNGCLNQSAVRVIVVDTTPGPKTYQHHQEILGVLRLHPEQWKLLGTYGPAKSVQVYSSTRTAEDDGDPLRRIHTNLYDGLQSWPIVERLTCSAGETPSAPER